MEKPITGGCLCGAVRYECTAEPLLMLKCHCRDCQRASGGPYVPAMIFPHSAFRVVSGEIRRHVTEAPGVSHNTRGFCAVCGSRLTGAENAERGIIGVVASSLDDPSVFRPTLEMWLEDAQPWDVLDASTPKHARHFLERSPLAAKSPGKAE